MSSETPEPAVGQVWKDNDPRSVGRKLAIIEIDAETGKALTRDTYTGRQTRIKLSRFRPIQTGYAYEREATAAELER